MDWPNQIDSHQKSVAYILVKSPNIQARPPVKQLTNMATFVDTAPRPPESIFYSLNMGTMRFEQALRRDLHLSTMLQVSHPTTVGFLT